jgi:hypothetical protein
MIAVGASDSPEYTGLFEAGAHHSFAAGFDQPFAFAAIEFRLLAEGPLFLTQEVAEMPESRHFPQALASMKQIDDLDSAGKVLRRHVPDPFGSSQRLTQRLGPLGVIEDPEWCL